MKSLNCWTEEDHRQWALERDEENRRKTEEATAQRRAKFAAYYKAQEMDGTIEDDVFREKLSWRFQQRMCREIEAGLRVELGVRKGDIATAWVDPDGHVFCRVTRAEWQRELDMRLARAALSEANGHTIINQAKQIEKLEQQVSDLRRQVTKLELKNKAKIE